MEYYGWNDMESQNRKERNKINMKQGRKITDSDAGV